jgi:hypothetical protein
MLAEEGLTDLAIALFLAANPSFSVCGFNRPSLARSLRLRRTATHGDMKESKGSPGALARVCVGDPSL